ncbi:MAG: hypothetical protein KGL39_46045 [Patescibacteria group bacterium]|nr:hypothetical protein [Patescibacteria group bacterium]
MGDVIHLNVPIPDNVTLDPDDVLDGSKGQFEQLLIAGYTKDGEFHVRSTHGSREVLWMLQRAIVHLMLETE